MHQSLHEGNIPSWMKRRRYPVTRLLSSKEHSSSSSSIMVGQLMRSRMLYIQKHQTDKPPGINNFSAVWKMFLIEHFISSYDQYYLFTSGVNRALDSCGKIIGAAFGRWLMRGHSIVSLSPFLICLICLMARPITCWDQIQKQIFIPSVG